MIHPEEMTKISVVGPKTQLETVVDRLHELGVLHIDDYSTEDGELDIGSPQENADELSATLTRLRSVRAKLPAVEGTPRKENGDVRDHIEHLQKSIDDIYSDLEEIRDKTEKQQELLDALQVVERLGLETADISEYSSIDMYVGAVADYDFVAELPDGRYELYRDGHLMALFVDSDVDVEDALREADFDAIDMSPVMNIDDDVSQKITRVEEELGRLANRKDEFEDELREIAEEWRGYLDEKEYELEEQLERAEAPLQFATTGSTFSAEGWIPTDRFDEVRQALEDSTDDRVHIEELDDDPHETPVKHDNPDGVDNFESLVGFFGTPSYTEVDPTFLLVTFPLLFGFMLGDIGYGITSFAVFYFMYRKFPAAEGLWKSLMFCSVATIVFGFMFAEMFGYEIFGEASVLTTLTGLQFFADIPIIFPRAHALDQVLTISLIIGVAHVNFGYLVGAYNELVEHGFMEAVFAKLSWIVIEIGAVVAYLADMYAGLGVIIVGVAMLFKGEGIEGVVEIPSLLSNILSYLRIFGVSIAIVALAAVVNKIATPFFQSGSIVMITLGVLTLIIGHTINTFLKIMESGLQGIRLHYVEFFTKFFEGGGEHYRPFGETVMKR